MYYNYLHILFNIPGVIESNTVRCVLQVDYLRNTNTGLLYKQFITNKPYIVMDMAKYSPCNYVSGIKLDFKSIDALEPSLIILLEQRVDIVQPVFINADILEVIWHSTVI